MVKFGLLGTGFGASAQFDPIEEQLASAYALLDAGALNTIEPVRQTFLQQYGVWTILAVVVVAVLLMFLMIVGSYRRQQQDSDPVEASPLFEEDELGYDTQTSLYGRQSEDDLAGSGFAEVVTDENEEQTSYFETAEIETEPLDVDEEHHDDSDMANVSPFAATEDQDAIDDVDHEDLNDHHQEDDQHEESDAEQAPTFASVRDAASDDDLPGRAFGAVDFRKDADEDEPAPSFDDDQLADELETETAYVADPRDSGDEAGAGQGPYIAPFIRDDIDKSERRQEERIDLLRRDFAQQVDTLRSEQASRLDIMIAAIDRKLESLGKRQADAWQPAALSNSNVQESVSTLHDQVTQISASIDGQGQRMRAITTILENRFAEVGKVHEDVRGVHEEVKSVRADVSTATAAVGAVQDELDQMKEHVGRLERAILDRAAQDSATQVRLHDVIKGTLPEDTYQFSAVLSNGEIADCLISFQGVPHKIAIDGAFPMEAFHELPSTDAVRRNLPQAKAAEDAFRRAILRSILEAADRCISAGDTTDSCLLFLPSEAAYTILHDRFPDLVRDSQRARVWLVSPSTLMGTLNLIRNLLPSEDVMAARERDAVALEERAVEERRLKTEIDTLRTRSTALSRELERTRGALRDLIGSPADDLPLAVRDELAMGSLDRDVTGIADAGRETSGSERSGYDGTPSWTAGSSSTSRDADAPQEDIRSKDDVDTLR